MRLEDRFQFTQSLELSRARRDATRGAGTARSEQIIKEPASGSREDAGFEQLLLELSSSAAQLTSAGEILAQFCRRVRAYFGVSSAYLAYLGPRSELIGREADGWMAEEFRQARLEADEAPVLAEALKTRGAVTAHALDPQGDRLAADFRARSALAVPVVISKETIGLLVLIDTFRPDFFRSDHAAKSTILTAQLGSFLEAERWAEQAKEEERRSKILAEVADSLRTSPELGALIGVIADRLRELLRTPLVLILGREAIGFEPWAVATEDPALAVSVRARQDRKGRAFASDIAQRAIAAGEPISVAVNPASHALGDLVPAGTLLAVPFRTASKEGAVLVYPRPAGSFTNEERKLLPVVTSFAGLAVANAELYRTARSQAEELHQIVTMASELGSVSDLESLMSRFLARASKFLSFRRTSVGLLNEGRIEVRWTYDNGRHSVVSEPIPDGILSQAILAGEMFWAEDREGWSPAQREVLRVYEARQIVAVPLGNPGGEVLGVFVAFDHLEHPEITRDDLGHAQAVAGQLTVAVEVSRNLRLAEEHRRRAESLTSLALEMNALVRGPQFAQKFLERAAVMMEASAAALIIAGGSRQFAILGSGLEDLDTGVVRSAIAALASSSEPVIERAASLILGEDRASRMGWSQLSLARLNGASGELVGALCLANRRRPWAGQDLELVQAIAGQAAVALENGRFFNRMEQANRHWIEIFDSITDFIVAHDPAGNVLRVNRSLADFIGVSPAQLIGLNMGALFATGPAPLSRACPFCRTTGNVTDEYAHPALERTFLVSTSEVHAHSSEGLQTIHVLKDITDRREAERRYRELFDNIQEGLFFSSPDGRFIEVNDALVRMLGYEDRESLLSADPREEVFPSEKQHGELFAEMERQGTLRNREIVLKRKQGGAVHVLVNAFAVRSAQGQVLQYRGLMLDISDLKAFQAELQRERDFSGKILNNTQSLILVADTAGLVSYANRRWQALGYEQPAMLGKTLQSLIAPAKRAWLAEAYAAVLAGSQVDNLELQILYGDGRIGQFSVNLSPICDDQGQVSSIVVVMSDVTDSASLQSKLMHAEKMAAVGQLVSGVAHEVNNPLTAILGFADLLMENPEVPESARKDLRVILQEAQRTKQIVQNLLSFARQMPPQRKPLELNGILKRTIQLRAYDLQSRGVRVTENFRERLPYVIGDSHQLQQVFLNILNNAYDAVRERVESPQIEISTTATEEFVEVSFRDNGSGISQPDRIFDPFFTTKQVGEGTGLGLSICYGIVKEHGGEILCANNADGEGATFTVRLPAVRLGQLSAAAGVTKP